jgi:hypothetical protein
LTLKFYLQILFLCACLLLGISASSLGQSGTINSSNWITKKIAITDTVIIDTSSIEKSSFSIIDIASADYVLLPFNSKLYWVNKPNKDSVTITYRKLDLFFGKIYEHKKLNNISSYLGADKSIFYEMDANSTNTIVDFGKMDYSGSLSRGLNFGNSQDVVLNSQFNLQLSGMLADSIEMQASITDNNIPFQPEGNTQNLQEFDQIFINFKKRNAKLILGDHDLLRPSSYFMNFYKRVQGVYFSNQHSIAKNINYKYGAGISLAKGKFVRTTVGAVEGNQGPYKIIGPNGESFFIILANSEKIYIDGILQKRGEDNDYIIDYNQAEIVFMPRKMITKDSRIIVEYEINERNYVNSLLYSTHEAQVGTKFKININAYSNQDAKKQTITQTLSANQEYLLSTIGDNISAAISPSFRQDTFSNNRVMYKLVDTSVAGLNYDSIFVFSTNKDSAKYVLNFSFVGANKGNYITAANLKNGRVYNWIAPINGIPQGDYIPFIVLVTPKRQQLFTIGTQYKIDDNKTLDYEVGISNNDLNLFSKIDDETHLGLAHKLQYTETRKIAKQKPWILNNSLRYEFVQQRFRPLERFRDAEFTRDWTIDFNPIPQNEQLASAKIEFVNADKTKLNYEFGSFVRGNNYTGIKNSFAVITNRNRWITNINGSITNSKFNAINSQYIRPSIGIEKTFSKLANINIGAKCSLENNTISYNDSDSILKNSFGFQVAQLNINNAASATNKFGAVYFTRRDQLPNSTKLQNVNQSHNFSLQSNINSLRNQTIAITSTYRKLIVLDTVLYKQKAEDNLLGRIDYNANALNSGVTYNILYEFGSGQELKREFTYLEVPIGQGVYNWIDYNSNRVQELNEFEVAQFPDQKKYIKVFTPTNQYVGAKFNTLNQTVGINFKQIFNNQTATTFKKFASLFVLQSSLQLTNKYIAQNGLEQFNPFYKPTSDTSLINNGTSLSNTVFFNRFGTIWGLDYVHALNNSRTLLTYGIDDRGNTDHSMKLRINITKQLTVNHIGKWTDRYFTSAFLNNRSYALQNISNEPTLSYISKNSNYRVVLSYKNETRNNTALLGGEKALSNSVSAEYKNTLSSTGNWFVRGSYNNITFNGEANSSIGFIMLDGLQNGKNYLWQSTFDKRLAKGIEISITYEGRKPGNLDIVHTGRASIRAIF